MITVSVTELESPGRRASGHVSEGGFRKDDSHSEWLWGPMVWGPGLNQKEKLSRAAAFISVCPPLRPPPPPRRMSCDQLPPLPASKPSHHRGVHPHTVSRNIDLRYITFEGHFVTDTRKITTNDPSIVTGCVFWHDPPPCLEMEPPVGTCLAGHSWFMLTW